MCFVDHEQGLLTGRKVFQKKFIQGIETAFFRLSAPLHGNAEFLINGLQKLQIGKGRIEDQGAFYGPVEPGQQGAAEGSLAVADAARNHHETFFFIDAVDKTIQGLLMLRTKVEIARIGI